MMLVPGLREMCAHQELRVLHYPGHDALSMRSWDGRLFVDNGGGSHHLAAAIHIAGNIGAPIPLTSKLYFYQFNSKTMQWLLDGFQW